MYAISSARLTAVAMIYILKKFLLQDMSITICDYYIFKKINAKIYSNKKLNKIDGRIRSITAPFRTVNSKQDNAKYNNIKLNIC